jgi:Zn-dependent protease with chaperone function
MNWPGIEAVAQVLVERALNSLPEGLLVAVLAWLLLRFAGRQNAGTRFAVWFVALAAVVGLSFPGIARSGGHLHTGPQLTLPAGWALAIFAGWALAACIALARVAVGLWQVWTIRRGCTEIDLSQLEPEIQEIFEKHGTGRPICLAVSEQVKVPAAIGFWKPAIVLPAWTLRELAPNELQPVLIHELTHLRRRDDWTNLLQKLARAIFFFHPAVWWIDARLSLEREMACDDTVLAITGNPRAYAGCLIELLEKSCARRGWTMAQAAVQRAQELSLRITRILDAKRPATTRVWKPALGLAGVFSLACLALSYCAPRLVAVGPNPSASAAIKAPLPAGDIDRTGMPAVIPASFHVPEPAPLVKNADATRKAAKPRVPTQPVPIKLVTRLERHAAAPQMVLAKAAQSRTDMISGQRAQMVVFVETAEFGYGENASVWKAQIWHIVLITPTLDGAQMGVAQGSI